MGVQPLLEEADLMVLRFEVDLASCDGDGFFLGDLVSDTAARPRDYESNQEDRREEGQLEDRSVPKRGLGSSVGRQRSPLAPGSR